MTICPDLVCGWKPKNLWSSGISYFTLLWSHFKHVNVCVCLYPGSKRTKTNPHDQCCHVLARVHCRENAEECAQSEQHQSFSNVRLCPSFHRALFPWMADVHNWDFICLDRLLWWRSWIQREERSDRPDWRAAAGPLSTKQIICTRCRRCVW